MKSGKPDILTRQPVPAQSTRQPNPFFQPWVQDNARRHLLAPHERFILVGGDQQIALPLAVDRRIPGWLPTVGHIWGHKHCFDSTPLAQNPSRSDIEALFDSLTEQGIHLLRWRRLPTDTNFATALLDFLENRGLAHEETKRYQRSLLMAGGNDPDSFLERLSKKRRKDLRRCRQRLSELGAVEFVTYQGRHDAAQWCDDFIELEASGWKGPSGTRTAIGCSENERAFFEAMAREGAAEGNIIVHSLTLDTRPIAMTVNFRSGSWAWAYKVAYREDLANLSPGVQLEVEGSLAFMNDPSIACVDSCTASGHSLMDNLWSGRRPMAEFLIAVRPSANPMVRASGLLWRRYLAVKNAARDKVKKLRSS
ncbi:GNAT family N-acetyltransferase [Aquamicrobium ahrensii]|uniref:CelD/BcsL family acetyltransferase involved in cellulose biosynthesis n=1 Tax=Aquamicrobium ahrensii TaxID=469551 RepID=A0ABV2KP99_9HYPH